MKRITFLYISLLMASLSSAQITDGFYRIRNNSTDRYITIWDNTFNVQTSTTDVDLSALVTIRDFNKIVSDPGSVLYIDNNENNECRLLAQGTDTYVASNGYYLKLRPQSNGTYMATVTAKGIMKVLGDSPDPSKSRDQAYVGTYQSGDTRYWKIMPLNSNDNYLGLTPTLTDGSLYYQTLYFAFAFTAQTTDMTFYQVTTIDKGMAVVEEITGTIPAETPVIVMTKHNEASKNKLTVSLSPTPSPARHLLKGNYFNYWRRAAQVAYNPATMRVLGKMNDGSVGFVKDHSLDFLDRNSAYIVVPEDFPDEVRMVSQSEYDEQKKYYTYYTVTYMVDGVVVGTQSVLYGSAITPLEAPTKEGYTFDGWSEIPSAMPDHDIIITGSFSVIDGIRNVIAAQGVVVYDLYGHKIAAGYDRNAVVSTLPPGLYIVDGRLQIVK